MLKLNRFGKLAMNLNPINQPGGHGKFTMPGL